MSRTSWTSGGKGHSPSSYWPTAHLMRKNNSGLGRESDRCKQKVNKHVLAESGAYFSLNMVIHAKNILYCTLIRT